MINNTNFLRVLNENFSIQVPAYSNNLLTYQLLKRICRGLPATRLEIVGNSIIQAADHWAAGMALQHFCQVADETWVQNLVSAGGHQLAKRYYSYGTECEECLPVGYPHFVW